MSHLKDKLDVASVGLEMGLAVAAGLWIGRWLDGELGTDPWLTFFFMACGFGAAVKAVLRAARVTRRCMAGDDVHDARSLVLPSSPRSPAGPLR